MRRRGVCAAGGGEVQVGCVGNPGVGVAGIIDDRGIGYRQVIASRGTQIAGWIECDAGSAIERECAAMVTRFCRYIETLDQAATGLIEVDIATAGQYVLAKCQRQICTDGNAGIVIQR